MQQQKNEEINVYKTCFIHIVFQTSKGIDFSHLCRKSFICKRITVTHLGSIGLEGLKTSNEDTTTKISDFSIDQSERRRNRHYEYTS